MDLAWFGFLLLSAPQNHRERRRRARLPVVLDERRRVPLTRLRHVDERLALPV